jgi:regulator of cell morphogenesis and NO signaling
MTTISSDITVGRIAAENPRAAKVFARYGIDYCCGGGKPLGEVCEGLGLEAATVLREIEEEGAAIRASGERWDQAPLGDLVIHIMAAYHRPLDTELPRLEALAAKVLEVHREKQPEMLAELLAVFRGLKTELEDHMAKEEEILFPMIRKGEGMLADGPIAIMEEEHEAAGAALRRLRELTGDYQVPAEACNTWRALWHGLAALEGALHQHIHLENNILFPRALAE